MIRLNFKESTTWLEQIDQSLFYINILMIFVTINNFFIFLRHVQGFRINNRFNINSS